MRSKAPKRTITLHVHDPRKLDTIKVGDPVVGKYYEALVIEVKKAGTAVAGVSAQQQPTIVAIDKGARTVTITGPTGQTETVKARDPKNLEAVQVGDLVEMTYTRALAIALDKSATK